MDFFRQRIINKWKPNVMRQLVHQISAAARPYDRGQKLMADSARMLQSNCQKRYALTTPVFFLLR